MLSSRPKLPLRVASAPAKCLGKLGALSPEETLLQRGTQRIQTFVNQAPHPRTPHVTTRAVGGVLERAGDTVDAQTGAGNAEAQSASRLHVREAQSIEEFEAVGWLRARAYYETEDPAAPARFQGSFTKQFAEQEARSLVERTHTTEAGAAPEAVCLLVTEPSTMDTAVVNSGNVVATADVRPPACAGGRYPEGVPMGAHEDDEGAYILNVVVGAKFRGSGCGKVIMTSAEDLARQRWGARRVYAHVSESNEAAWNMYKGLGYEMHEAHAEGDDVLLCKHID